MRNPAALVVLGALCVRGYAAEKAPAPAISVLVFNYSGIPADILEPALRESNRIMESAGVELVWVACPIVAERLALEQSCRQAPGPLALMLQILPRGTSRHQTGSGAFGFAVPAENGGFGAYAGVFHDRIEKLGATIGKAALLGHLIAHELGHLLIGTGHHSARGIMKGHWRRDQLELASRRALRFDEGERRRILMNVRRRVVASRSAIPATSGRGNSRLQARSAGG